MHDLPVSLDAQPSRTVSKDAPRPTAVWTATQVVTLLSIYYQPDESDAIFEAQVEAWKVALMDLPQEAIALAIRDRICSDDRRRPVPGEIRARAKSYICAPSVQWGADVEEPKELISGNDAERIARETFGGDVPAHVVSLVEAIKRRDAS